jgi:hypothetical protein
MLQEFFPDGLVAAVGIGFLGAEDGGLEHGKRGLGI